MTALDAKDLRCEAEGVWSSDKTYKPLIPEVEGWGGLGHMLRRQAIKCEINRARGERVERYSISFSRSATGVHWFTLVFGRHTLARAAQHHRDPRSALAPNPATITSTHTTYMSTSAGQDTKWLSIPMTFDGIVGYLIPPADKTTNFVTKDWELWTKSMWPTW